MRKAALKNRGRNKGKPVSANSNESNDGQNSGQGGDALPPGAPNNAERRKPTNDEAALSNKNYRLAKELSELRVRLRDETKSVTRLTMENMNLATRCREAISHVAMLKRELVMTQRRAAEAINFERQQLKEQLGQGGPIDLSLLDNASTTIRSPDEEFDRLSPMPPPPPPPPPPKYTNPPQDHSIGPLHPKQEMFGIFDTDEVMIDDSVFATQPNQNIQQNSSIDSSVDSSFSDSNAMSDQEGPADELLFDKKAGAGPITPVVNGVPISTDHFLQSSCVSPPNSKNEESSDEFDPTTFQPFTTPSSENTKYSDDEPAPLQQSSSLDAFEASWSSTFPTTFSNFTEEPPPVSLAFDVPEFTDPFFLGSLDLGVANRNGNEFGELSSSSFELPSSNSSTNIRGGSKLTDSKNRINEFDPKAQQFDGTAANERKQANINNHISSSPPGRPTKHPISAAAASEKNFDGFNTSPASLFPSSAMDVFEFMDETPISQHRKSNGSNSLSGGPFQTPRHTASEETSDNASASSPPRVNKKGISNRARYVTPSTEQGSVNSNDFDDNPSTNFVNGNVHNQGNVNASHRRLHHRRAKDGDRSVSPSTVQTTAGGAALFDNKHATRTNSQLVSNTNPAIGAREITGNRLHQMDKGIVNHLQQKRVSPRVSPTNGGVSPKFGDTSNPNFTSSSASSSGSVTSTRSKNTNRRVRHPVSYTEPNLNSKLRRGDVFFPKKDVASNDLDPESHSISPTHTESKGRLVSSGFSEPDLTLTDDILKDLASASVIHNVT